MGRRSWEHLRFALFSSAILSGACSSDPAGNAGADEPGDASTTEDRPASEDGSAPGRPDAGSTSDAGGGRNDAGGARGASATSIAVGYRYSCAIRADGRVKCWGSPGITLGKLGTGDRVVRGDQPGEMGAALPFVDLGTGRKAKSVASHFGHACAVLDDDTLKCWGTGGDGRLGFPSGARGGSPGDMGDALPRVDLGPSAKVASVAVGEDHSCAILTDGSLRCWGSNAYGQLGLGDKQARGDTVGEMGAALPPVALGTGRTAKHVALGTYRTCAILDDGSVKCWGRNSVAGYLGLGDTADRGDDAGEMGDALPVVRLGTGRKAMALSMGYATSCAVLDDGALKCWGYVVGHGSTPQSWGKSPAEMGDALPRIDLGTGRKAVSVACGSSFVCAILDGGSVKCFGGNAGGELGIGDTTLRGDRPGQMGDALPAVDLGVGRRAVEIAAAPGGHVCAQLDDGAIKCWGLNAEGELGLGDTNPRGASPGTMGAQLPPVDLGP